jgi:NAD+ kinase
MAAQVIGLTAHVGKAGAADLLAYLVGRFEGEGRTVLLEDRAAALIGRPGSALAEVSTRAELLVVLGGDGSLLRTVHQLDGSVPPVFGINLGSLGFLTCVSSQDRERAAQAVLSGRFVVSPRSLIEVKVERDGRVEATGVGLNEAVVSRGAHSRLVQLDVRIDGCPLARYNADGLIIATPTGSTAYALSAGGPIVAPDAGVFVVNPVCPHVLTNRAMVVPDASCIELTVCAGEEEVLLTVDGHAVADLCAGDRVVVAKAARTVRLAMPEGTTFFDLLRQKLKWSGTNV